MGMVKMSEETTTKSPREEVLDAARDAVMRSRNNTYGPPNQDFSRTAAILNAMGFRFHTVNTQLFISADQVALIMIALKMSRSVWAPEHMDNWVDIAGYAACAWECVEEESGF